MPDNIDYQAMKYAQLTDTPPYDSHESYGGDDLERSDVASSELSARTRLTCVLNASMDPKDFMKRGLSVTASNHGSVPRAL